jgi:hypothetical protein
MNYYDEPHFQSDDPYLQSLLSGQKLKLNRMNRKLSFFFYQTSKIDEYANNRNSKGRLVPSLITLTYPDNSFWSPKDISAFVNKLRMYAKRKMGLDTLRYAWVAETTKKGIIHYHLVVWHPRNKRFPRPDDQGWWKHISNISGVRKGVYSYMRKYLSKGCAHPLGFPVHSVDKLGRRRVARMFGMGGMSLKQRAFLNWQMLPSYIKDHFVAIPAGLTITRKKGYFQLGNKPFVQKIGDYLGYLTPTLLCNYSVVTSPYSGDVYYEFGAKWEPIPEPADLVVIPF